MDTATDAVKITPKRKWWRIAKRWMRSLVVIYLLVCVVLYFLQTRLIFPGALGQGTEDAVLTVGAGGVGEEIVRLKTPEGTEIAGFFGKAFRGRVAPSSERLLVSSSRQNDASLAPPDANAGTLPVVLYFYGNGECMNFCRGQADMFRSLGYHCMLVDYAGFGMSGGVPSEAGCYAAAEAAYAYVLTRGDVDKRKVVVAGWSLGGAVAIEVAWRHRGEGVVAGVMTWSAFSSMVDVAREQYPFLPVGLLLRHRFMSIEKVGDLAVPYFLGHGGRDAMVPARHAERLAGAYGGKVTRYVAGEAGHNDIFEVGGEELKRVAGEWLRGVVGEEL